MITPFTNFIANEKGKESSGPLQSEMESYSPFVMNTNEATESFTAIADNEEETLSADDISKAVKLNEIYKVQYKWGEYLPQILEAMGVNMFSGAYMKASPEAFAKGYADWQIKNGFSSGLMGVLGLNGWTYFQKKIGLHNLGNNHNINVDEAIKNNKYYKEKLWQHKTDSILQVLADQKIVSRPLPLNDEYFAYAIASFQSKAGIKADGVLGPDTLKLFSTSASSPLPANIHSSAKRSKWFSLIPGTSPSYARPLVYGVSAFRTMVDAIRTAQSPGHFIYITGWMLEIDFPLIPNDLNTTLFNLLKAADAKGVEIRILIWNNPYYTNSLIQIKTRLDSLKNAKLFIDGETAGSAAVEEALSDLRTVLGKIPDSLASKLNSNDTFSSLVNFSHQQNEGSHHEKIMIVQGAEGLRAFCGGIDINSNRIGGFVPCNTAAATLCVSDADPVAPKIYTPTPVFKTNSFFPKTVEILHDVHCEVRNAASLQLLNQFKKRWSNYISANPVSNSNLTGGVINSAPLANSNDVNTANVKIIHTYNQKNGVEANRTIFNTVKTAIANAEKSIHIEDQYMLSIEIAGLLNKKLLSPDFKTGTVSFLTQDDAFAREDNPIIKRMRKEFVDTLYKGLSRSDPRVSLYMLNPDAPFPAHHQVHSKLYIIDRELVIIGSANCSRRSMTNDSETAAVIFKDAAGDSSFVEKIESRYDRNFPWIAYKPNDAVLDIDFQILKDLPLILINHPEIALALGAATMATPWVIIAFQKQVPELIKIIVDPNNQRPATVQEQEEEYMDPENEEGEWGGFHEQEAAKAKTNSCDTRTCWAKTVLNRELNLQLSMSNTVDTATKEAILSFQSKYQLPASGKIDAVTERELLEKDSLKRAQGTMDYPGIVALLSLSKSKIEDWTSKAVNNKPQYILNSYRDPRQLTAFVLHQMAFKRKGRDSGKYSDPTAYLSTGAHFCILLDGRIIQLHAMSRMIWHGNCVSPKSVAVEFEGNFPNVKGKWWKEKGAKYGDNDRPTEAQFESGRFLARYLKAVIGIRHILAHRQSSDSRENDPGPDIWYNVGQWAVDNLGIQDGGPGFKCGSGNPITEEWRTWGKNKTTQNEYLDAVSEPEEPQEMEEQFQEGEWVSEFEEADVSKAIRLNRYYSSSLGWDKFQDAINDLVLPFSGQSNVSLGEEDFARAVSGWQKNNGFTGMNADGVIGPATWAKMQTQLTSRNTGGVTAPVTTGSSTLSGSLGVLTINTRIPALKDCIPEYRFTTEDALWLARFVEGEAGGKDNADSHAVIWAMFNRFGLLRHKVPSWTSLSVFLQKYSTTLQPLLNSKGAAERVWANHLENPDKFPVVSSDSFYPGTTIKKVQYLRHIQLQQKKWEAFPEYVRKMVLNILRAIIPNPGIGIATDFDSTWVFMITARKKAGNSNIPSYQEWKEYTYQHALSKNMIWIGEKAALNQQKNAFYILNYLKDVPADSVQVIFNPVTGQHETFSFEQPDQYESDQEYENYFTSEAVDFFFESINSDKAVVLNRKYAASLGWDVYYSKINDLLLPFSGWTAVSLSENSFAEALAKWQTAQGFDLSDCDGILGPKTWAKMKPLLSADTVPYNNPLNGSDSPPSVDNTLEFNCWHARKILEHMNAGFIGQSFQSKEQLEMISRGEKINQLDPASHIIQALPVIYHIAANSRKENYREIIIGSFIRKPDADGTCTGHCAGRCIDINITSRSFETEEASGMVIKILGYLTGLPQQYKKSIGFGMPLQGQFFGHQALPKYKGVSTSLLKNEEIRKLVNQLGYVFPDNDNHLHIQVNWLSRSAANYETEVVYEAGESYEVAET